MKTLVTYYSYSGNTHKVLEVIKKVLEVKGETAIQRLKPKKEITNFFAQCKAAARRERAELAEDRIGTIFDASPYDLVLMGLPVWALAPVPAINTYLDNVNGLNGKKVIVLLTSGSGLGVKKCFETIKDILKAKGVSRIGELNIPNRKMKDENFIASSFQNVLSDITI